MKIRIKFSKHGVLKFVGHLDMMRYFQKAIRRSGIDIVYTQGYSPHQVMSFAAPLGVGLESDGEYFDIEVHSSECSRTALKKLNAQMADGVRILSYKALPQTAKNAMASVAAASYRISFQEKEKNPFTFHRLEEAVFLHILSCPQIPITKKTKKGGREVDLKTCIYRCRAVETDTGPGLWMLLAAGSAENIKPELVFTYLFEKMGECVSPYDLQVVRTDVYALKEGADCTGKPEDFEPLSKAGEDIV